MRLSKQIAIAFLLTFSFQLNAQQPTPAQKSFMELKYGMFICFGINTFNDREWSKGDLPISSVDVKEIDTDQWCKVASDAGLKYVIFTTNHHDGFCNWDTKLTEYKISNTSFEKDLLRQLAASCKKYDLKLGLYYSLWNENEKSFKTDELAFNQFLREQITELLTNYGDVACLWFDGFWKRQSSGWKKLEGEVTEAEIVENNQAFINSWRNEGAYRFEWDQLYNLIKSLQSNCVVFNNPTTAYKAAPLFPVDARPAEKGHELAEDKKIWNWLGKEVYLPLQIETTLSQKGNEKFPSGNWFWHEWDHSVATKDQVEKWAENAHRLEANLVINVGPNRYGKLRNEDIELLKAIELK